MSNDLHLAYETHQGNGPALVLLHGFLSSNAQWQQNLAALKDACTPITVELWGHGNSPSPHDADRYSPQGYLAELEHIRQTLNIEQWFLCGYSLGAGITIRYAAEYPERTLGHVFTNSQSGLAPPELIANWQADNDSTAEKIIAKGKPAIERIAVHPRFAKRLPADVRGALLADAEKLDPLGVANTIRYTTPSVSTRDIAPNNSAPALLCFGVHEKRFHASKAWAETHMTNLDIVELDAAHAVNMEDPEGFNAALIDFIQR